MEDYLEAIAQLAKTRDSVRVTQLSEELGVSKPSVSAALSKLSNAGLVRHERYGTIDLTNKGRKLADDVIRRHQIMFRLLTDILGVDRETAEKDACKMEHILSSVSLERLTQFVEFLTSCPRSEPAWHKGFSSYVEHGKPHPDLVGK